MNIMSRSNIKEILRVVFYPLLFVRRLYNKKRQIYLGKNNPKRLCEELYAGVMKKPLDWDNPKDYNEKINWLKFYGDTSLWPICADKYRVRDYIKGKGLGHILVKLYGKWDRIEDVNWDILPSQFVLKANNRSGDVLIVKDKSKLNIAKVTKKYSGILKNKFGYRFGEPHYNLIEPCIIIEELLDGNQVVSSSSLIDYKIFCFDGKPMYIEIILNRTLHGGNIAMYDINWISHSEYIVNSKYIACANIPKPDCLEEMLAIASELSKGFPQVRVDLYVVDNSIYFGEMTFTIQSGFMNFLTNEFLYELGGYCKLPNRDN